MYQILIVLNTGEHQVPYSGHISFVVPCGSNQEKTQQGISILDACGCWSFITQPCNAAGEIKMIKALTFT